MWLWPRERSPGWKCLLISIVCPCRVVLAGVFACMRLCPRGSDTFSIFVWSFVERRLPCLGVGGPMERRVFRDEGVKRWIGGF